MRGQIETISVNRTSDEYPPTAGLKKRHEGTPGSAVGIPMETNGFRAQIRARVGTFPGIERKIPP